MSTPRSGRRRPGPAPQLTLEAILDAVEQVGLDRFSVTAVAERLGVRDSTIYKYVDSRERLAALACSRAYCRLEVTAPDAAMWTEYLEVISQRSADLAVRHPGLSPYLQQGPYEPETLAVFDVIIHETMSRFPGLDAGTAWVLASRVVLLSVSYVTAAPADGDPELAEVFRSMMPWMRRALIGGMASALARGDRPPTVDWHTVSAAMRRPGADGDTS